MRCEGVVSCDVAPCGVTDRTTRREARRGFVRFVGFVEWSVACGDATRRAPIGARGAARRTAQRLRVCVKTVQRRAPERVARRVTPSHEKCRLRHVS